MTHLSTHQKHIHFLFMFSFRQSGSEEAAYGVPQGSTLGPLFFFLANETWS